MGYRVVHGCRLVLVPKQRAYKKPAVTAGFSEGFIYTLTYPPIPKNSENNNA